VRFRPGLEQADQGRHKYRRLKTDCHFFEEALAGLEVEVGQIECKIDVLLVLILLNQGNCALHKVRLLVVRALLSDFLRLLLGLTPALAHIVQHFLLTRHRHCFVQIGRSLFVAVLGELLRQIYCVLAFELEVLIHETLGNFKEN